MIAWVIYYEDDHIFTSADGHPWEAPREGVQMVVVLDEQVGYRHEGSRAGYWVWRAGQWMGVDNEAGFWDYLYHSEGPCTVLFGRTLTDQRWGELLARVAKDIGVGKSAWSKREYREAP